MWTRSFVREVLSDLAPYLQDDQEVKFRVNMAFDMYDNEPAAYPCFVHEEADNHIEFTVKLTKELRDLIKADD